jgi:hypothetical protein
MNVNPRLGGSFLCQNSSNRVYPGVPKILGTLILGVPNFFCHRDRVLILARMTQVVAFAASRHKRLVR